VETFLLPSLARVKGLSGCAIKIEASQVADFFISVKDAILKKVEPLSSGGNDNSSNS
jgi:hypothetical protein